MIELTIVDYFVMGEAVGIVSTFIATLYYSRKQMQKVSMDIESKILNDLDDKMHNLSELSIARPELAEIFNREAGSQSPKDACAMYALNVFSYSFRMHKRKILRENEWNGWLRTIRTAFKEGTIEDYWKDSELEHGLILNFKNLSIMKYLSKTTRK